MTQYSGNIVDVLNETIYPGTIYVENGKIVKITKDDFEYKTFILPGFIDAHIHIESSMLPPSEFARIAVKHGTIACVSDAHEIANVLGVDGVKFMIENGKSIPFHYYFSAPSCVPATNIETSGASISAKEIEQLIKEEDIRFMGEMMNFPGVIRHSPDVMEKLAIAKKYNIPIDGHAPGLMGDDLKEYIKQGISTDHESFSRDEAFAKMMLGMKVLIREGSAVKNFDELINLAELYPRMMMFCSDDKHPDDLVKSHIDLLVKKSISAGINKMDTLRMACVNPVLHYKLDVGLLQEGDSADFIEVNNLHGFKVIKTVIKGALVMEDGEVKIAYKPARQVNNFVATEKKVSDFFVEDKGKDIKVIEIIDHQLVTAKSSFELKGLDGNLISDIDNDILKITVINRYSDIKPVMSFVRGFELKEGAIASSVAHDSHNIIVVGTSDEEISMAANMIIKNKGGVAYVNKNKGINEVLPLPIAGLMSDKPYEYVADKYAELDILTKMNGVNISAPFMTLSFMALLVIPSIKLSDLGLFDGEKFELTDIYA